MNQEMLSQVTEIIKTINLNTDISSETLTKIAPQIATEIMRYMYFIQIKSLFINSVWAIAVIVSAVLFTKALSKVVREDK